MDAAPGPNADPSAHVTKARKAALWQELVISGISVGGATTCTNPFDVIKTRLQLQSRSTAAGAGPPPGLVRTGVNIVRDEGLLSLWNGLTPAVTRGFLYGGMRLGLYGPCKDLISTAAQHLWPPSPAPTTSSGPPQGAAPPHGGPHSGGLAGLGLKALAGVLSGAVAAGLTSPTELVKTRLQARGCEASGPLEVIRTVVRQDGVAGLWRGALPSMARAALLTSSQVATYDSVKREVMCRTGWSDSVGTHLSASSLTGLVTTTVTNPADVVKTKMFVAGGAARRGISETMVAVLREDGLAGFFKGWTANYARLGPQTVITFLISEALRKALGLEGL